MDTRTGEIYPSRKVALEAGVPADALVTGPERALRELSRMVKRDIRERRRRRRRMEKASRKANRGR